MASVKRDTLTVTCGELGLTTPQRQVLVFFSKSTRRWHYFAPAKFLVPVLSSPKIALRNLCSL